MIKSSIVLTFLLISFNALMAQEKSDCKCTSGIRARVFKDHPPRFVDSSLFVQHLREKINLKSMIDEQMKDTLFNDYIYHFEVGINGEILPLYSLNNWPMFKEIDSFINETFNHYKWEPGYKKKCKRCVIPSHLILGVLFGLENNMIAVRINMVVKPGYKIPPILYLDLPYESLRTF